MISLVLLFLLLPFVGGFAIKAMIFGRWRQRLLVIWATLPLVAYLLASLGMLILEWLRSASFDWGQGFSWFLIGLFGFVGLPILVFGGSSVLGYFVAPALKQVWRLKEWRLPQ